MADILVTGATGFTGTALCTRLRAQGNRVVAFTRPTSRVEALRNLGVEVRAVELGDPASVGAAFERFDVVYHIAAAYRSEHASRAEFVRVNVDGTRHLLEASQAHGVGRFVHCSTVGVQGEIEQPPADENYRFKPGDHYQESKLHGELLARSFFERGALPGAVVRPVGIYGPGDLRFLKLFRSIANGTFVMIGDGQVLYHMTYIDDLVSGFILAGTQPAALGEVFTIAGPEYTTLRVLVDKIARVLQREPPRLRIPFAPVYWASVVCDKLWRSVGASPPLYPRRVEFFELDRAFSIEKARRLLGYEPQYSLDEGLAKTAAWYRAQGLIGTRNART
jgi:nucleoside-diphosphate-sugar epimerase